MIEATQSGIFYFLFVRLAACKFYAMAVSYSPRLLFMECLVRDLLLVGLMKLMTYSYDGLEHDWQFLVTSETVLERNKNGVVRRSFGG